MFVADIKGVSNTLAEANGQWLVAGAARLYYLLITNGWRAAQKWRC